MKRVAFVALMLMSSMQAFAEGQAQSPAESGAESPQVTCYKAATRLLGGDDLPVKLCAGAKDLSPIKCYRDADKLLNSNQRIVELCAARYSNSN